MLLKSSPIKVLTFDIENRPLSYWYDGNCTAEITAISWSFGDTRNIHTLLLGEHELPYILERFVAAYNQATIVTGHYIRKHDLPIINGALMELGMTALSPKESSDTKLDLMKAGSLSFSQESLAGYLGIDEPKVHMDQVAWREANRLTDEGLALTKVRVEGDIRQHIAMRNELIKRGWLGPTKEWRPLP